MIKPTLLVLLTACNTTPDPAPEASTEAAATPETTERVTADGLTLVEVDLNGDGVPEVFNYYRERSQADRLLVKREANIDGRNGIDVTSYYDEAGALTSEEIDGDFDGDVDWKDTYMDGQRTLSEVDTDSDGDFDLTKYFVDGELVRKERDTTNNGQVDLWELYEDGKVVKAGRDTSGDGNIDIKMER